MRRRLASLNSIMPTPGLGGGTRRTIRRRKWFSSSPTHRRQDRHNLPKRDLRLQQALPAAARTRRCARPSTGASRSRSSTRSTFNSSISAAREHLRLLVHELGRQVRRAQVQACASPGFFSDVQTGGTITQALTGPVHQGRLKYRQPHALRKAAWPKCNHRRKKAPQSLWRLYQGRKRRSRVRTICCAVSRPDRRPCPDVPAFLCAVAARKCRTAIGP